MSLKLTISDEMLQLPGVATAVHAFIEAVAELRLRGAEPGAPPAPVRKGRYLPPVIPASPAPARPVFKPKAKAPPPPKPPKPVRPLIKLPPPAPRPRKVPVPKVKLPPPIMDFPEFEASLPENSRRFLALVREKGIVRVEDVMKALELETPKAVGGITGAISRWAPVRGVTLPYDTLTWSGERIWRWHGVELPEEPTSTPASTPKPKPKKVLLTLDQVLESLSAPARKLLDAVRAAGSMGINDAVSVAGVNRASALTSVLAEIREITEANELRILEDTVDMRGSRMFRWHAPPVVSAAPAAADDPDKEYATDGVIRRRRKG